jgi:polyhydroxyalkanoate synthesis regulator phasin
MKIKIEVDLEEIAGEMIYDECSEIKEYVKADILKQFSGVILPKIQGSIDKLLSEKITPVFNALVNEKVLSTLDDLIEKGEMTERGAKVLIKDYVIKQFEQNTGWNSPDEKIKQIAKKFGEEMKLQYNNCFAMNIVKNLSEQGLLNDDVARALLAPSKQLSKPN